MTTTPPSLRQSKSPSRRALLAGALGGLGALAASAIGRASPVRAADDGQVMHVGDEWADALTSSGIGNQTNNETVFHAESSHGGIGLQGSSSSFYGVYGSSSSSYGVYGSSSSDIGVGGSSNSSYGVAGTSSSFVGSLGYSLGGSTGVQGVSGGSPPAAKAKTGVYGYANQDSSAKGIWGQSPNGRGVMGSSSTGWAGYFSGRVYTERYTEMKEVGNPSAPGANRLRLFARDNGSGKTQLCVRFPTGAVQVIKTEP
jgi:hypothetical protein